MFYHRGSAGQDAGGTAHAAARRSGAPAPQACLARDALDGKTGVLCW